MLVVSRHVGESVHIGPDITVTLVGLDRGKVRIGITCPREILVLREELLGRPAPSPASPEKGGQS